MIEPPKTVDGSVDKMKHKILAIDLDGTLLDGRSIPLAHQQAVRLAMSKGFRVIIATARWRHMAEDIQQTLGCRDLIIACNGAQLYDPITGKDLVDHRLSVDLGNRFTRVVSGIPGFASATIDNETLIQTESSSVKSSWSPPLRAVREFPDFQEEAPRILTVQGEQMVEAVKTAFASEPREQLLMLDSKGPTGETVLTLTTSAASKGNCLRIACSALNQSPDAVIAFGDSEGDLDLFETAGLSVAMGQALPSVRNAADCVTDANYENGIATFLDAYFEGKFNDAF